MKLAEILTGKVRAGEVKPAELPQAVTAGVRRFYAQADDKRRYAESFTWAESAAKTVKS
jgi:hypothetical protein